MQVQPIPPDEVRKVNVMVEDFNSLPEEQKKKVQEWLAREQEHLAARTAERVAKEKAKGRIGELRAAIDALVAKRKGILSEIKALEQELATLVPKREKKAAEPTPEPAK